MLGVSNNLELQVDWKKMADHIWEQQGSKSQSITAVKDRSYISDPEFYRYGLEKLKCKCFAWESLTDRAEPRPSISMSNLIAPSCLAIGGSLNSNEECKFRHISKSPTEHVKHYNLVT